VGLAPLRPPRRPLPDGHQVLHSHAPPAQNVA
jgi:hypothetical protein